MFTYAFGSTAATLLTAAHYERARRSLSLLQVSSIETLDVSSNTIENVPEEVRQLQNLVALNLGHNKLRALPEALGVQHSRRMIKYRHGSVQVKFCVF